MSWLSKLWSSDSSGADEQAVIVRFRYGSTDLSDLFALEDKLEEAIKSAKAGEYDGHDIAVDASGGNLYMYGPNADVLLGVIEPILSSAPFMDGAEAVRRYGKPNSGAQEVSSTIKAGRS